MQTNLETASSSLSESTMYFCVNEGLSLARGGPTEPKQGPWVMKLKGSKPDAKCQGSGTREGGRHQPDRSLVQGRGLGSSLQWGGGKLPWREWGWRMGSGVDSRAQGTLAEQPSCHSRQERAHTG